MNIQENTGLKGDELEGVYIKWKEYQDIHRDFLFDIVNKGVDDLTLARYLRGFLFELVPENFETYVNEHNLLEHWIPEGDREWQELMKLAEQEDRNKSIREAAE